ncbi:hypothetical protein HJA82_29495 [Rhizobium bangladeshense]|uniref:hypothetical protein n=1 Tax=Rhizobium bangladeshense TaxID=1138189 RepID=UPI001C83A7F0|nr:hypothetical protein [Rhizobium bangladeshense]MBX4911451.1 hypothetical protein [Rhizobium bangladeshense]
MPQMINGREFPAAGDELVFLDANGYDSDRKEANKFFTKDQILKVKSVDVGNYSTSVEFEEAPGKRFNSVMFEPLGADVLPEEEPEGLHTLQVTGQQCDMILAALRLWIDVVNDGAEYINEGLIDIATNGGINALMDDNEIDQLCEAING